VEIKYIMHKFSNSVDINFLEKSRKGIAILTSANIFSLFSVSYVICFSCYDAIYFFFNNNLYFFIDFGSTLKKKREKQC
jgi:hypothetical protein